jgi:putative nucleotidyltransferase with HDIG domain
MLTLSVSFGLATKTLNSEDITDIFKKAEENMYDYKLTESPRWKLLTIDHILEALYQKAPYERRHSEAVSHLCTRMGIELGMNSEEIENLKMASLYHDIGKIAIHNRILEKPGRLSSSERKAIEKHVVVGYQILNSISGNYHISQIILHHHEHWDGSGYPDGTTGEAIPVKSRIIAIAEAYDSMVNDHPYRKAVSEEEALEEIVHHCGTQFDPELASVLMKVIPFKN